MPLTTPRELFLHELADAMSSEHIILGMLPELQKESQDPEAKTAFKEHEAETKQHIKNLDAVFKQLNETPKPTTCYATEGIKKEHEALHKENPSPDVMQMGILGGAAKTEHYEIASYIVLVQMATDLGEQEAARLLQQNLTQEQAMAKRVEAIVKRAGTGAKAGAAGAATQPSKDAGESESVIYVPRHAGDADKPANEPIAEASGTEEAGTTVNGAHVKGIPVISIADGEKVGTVDRIYVDLASKKLIGFEIAEESALLVPGASFKIDTEEVRSVGPDALTIESRADVTGAKTTEQLGSLEDIDEIVKRKVITEGGAELGAVASVGFDDKQFNLTQIEVSPGMFKTNKTIPIEDVVTFGTDRVIVTDAAGAEPEPEPQEESNTETGA